MAETTFVRTRKDRNYTMLDNTFLRDKRLSAGAKGVFAYLLFLPEDWVIYQSELANHFSNGRDSIRNIISELEKFGYIIKEKVRAKNGTFGGYSYKIIETPDESDNPELVNRDGKSAADNPKTENPTLPITNNNQELNKPITDKPTSSSPDTELDTSDFNNSEPTDKLNTVKSQKVPSSPSPKAKKSTQTFSNSDYLECLHIITENKDKLSAKGLYVEGAEYTIQDLKGRLKKKFSCFGVEKTRQGLINSVNNEWLRDHGYPMNGLFSDKMFPKYIANEQSISNGTVYQPRFQQVFDDKKERTYDNIEEGRF